MAEAAACSSAPLSPLSQSQLNCGGSSSKKRKHADNEVQDSYLQPFTATLLPEINERSTHTLLPLIRLDRSQLRLSYLDYDPLQNSLPSGQQFYASISLLGPDPITQNSKLLLARLAPNTCLYVIERVGDDVFVACRLRSWVKEDHFEAGVHGSAEDSTLKRFCGQTNGPNPVAHPPAATGLSGVSTTAVPSPKRPKYKKGVLARMSILARMGLQTGSTAQQEQVRNSGEAVIEPEGSKNLPAKLPSSSCLTEKRYKPSLNEGQLLPTNSGMVGKVDGIPDTLSSADDLLATYHDILLRTLYMSRTALAHFTKSTLARTRATFRSSTNMTVFDLADFYRTRLISSKKMDLKYRDTIPKVIENVILQESSRARVTNEVSIVSPRKASKKKKLGKDGLYAGEEDFIRTWWLNRDQWENEVPSAHAPGQNMQVHVTELRNRETQLQIILILEILAIESRTDVRGGNNPVAASIKQETKDDVSSSVLATTSLKLNKKRDLRPDLDILVDRLCIYQTVGVADPTVAGEVKTNGEPGNEGTDKLRDFCCHVILPFYLHKAPDLVKEVSRKLGGPDVCPKRPNTSRTTTPPQTKPGRAILTRQRSIPRQTLERVLSEEQTSRQSSPPILIGASSAPLGGSCNRDPADPSQRPCVRGNLQKSQSFTNREVDLAANSRAHASKQKKLANLAKQKEELHAAIHALKKPNRIQVAGEIMAEFEKRNVERKTLRRRTLGRKSSDQGLGVEITATPRKATILSNITCPRLSLKDDISCSSDSRGITKSDIASSAAHGVDLRHHQCISKASGTNTTRRALCSTVQETPSRGSCRTSNPLALSPSNHDLQPPDPLRRAYLSSELSLVETTPSTDRVRDNHEDVAKIDQTPLRMTKSQRPVMFMQLQKADVKVESVFDDALSVPKGAAEAMKRVMDAGGGVGKEVSIYDSLGWDDDIDELL